MSRFDWQTSVVLLGYKRDVLSANSHSFFFFPRLPSTYPLAIELSNIFSLVAAKWLHVLGPYTLTVNKLPLIILTTHSLSPPPFWHADYQTCRQSSVAVKVVVVVV